MAARRSSRCSPSSRCQLRGCGRSALHQPVGTRFPAGVPAARTTAPAAAGDQPARLYGDGDRARPARHRRPARRCTIPSNSSARSTGRILSIACCPGPASSGSSRTSSAGIAAKRASSTARRGKKWTRLRAGSRASAFRRLPYHAGLSDARSEREPGRVPQRARRRHRRHGRLRHGHRSVERPLHRARRCAAVAGTLSAGIGPRRPRWARGGVRAHFLVRGLHEVARDARAKRRADAKPTRTCCARWSATPRASAAGIATWPSTLAIDTTSRAAAACDYCLNELESAADPVVIARKDPVVRRARRPAVRRHARVRTSCAGTRASR